MATSTSVTDGPCCEHCHEDPLACPPAPSAEDLQRWFERFHLLAAHGRLSGYELEGLVADAREFGRKDRLPGRFGVLA